MKNTLCALSHTHKWQQESLDILRLILTGLQLLPTFKVSCSRHVFLALHNMILYLQKGQAADYSLLPVYAAYSPLSRLHSELFVRSGEMDGNIRKCPET